MDDSRIRDCMDVDRMRNSKVVFFGSGAVAGLGCNLVRCCLGAAALYDIDTVSAENISRQAHSSTAIGQWKTESLATEFRRINPDISVECFNLDMTALSDEELAEAFADADLLICATDNFKAQAFGNQIALKFGIPTVWIGAYAGGGAGEIVYWAPDILACFRCLCAKRYEAHEKAASEGRSLDPSSHGCTINDITLLDCIAGDIIIGLLTRGADNRFGRLIDQLGFHNFLQVQFDPTWLLHGRNPIRTRLGIPADCTSYFSWNTMVLSDPDQGQLYCPDCEKYRGHIFWPCHGKTVRIVPEPDSARLASAFAASAGVPHVA